MIQIQMTLMQPVMKIIEGKHLAAKKEREREGGREESKRKRERERGSLAVKKATSMENCFLEVCVHFSVWGKYYSSIFYTSFKMKESRSSRQVNTSHDKQKKSTELSNTLD